MNKISLIVGGEAGAGITRSGFLFAKACVRGGFCVFGTNDYQSLIRGGHNFYVVRAEAEEIYSQEDTIALLLALNKDTFLLHRDKLTSGGAIVYDGDEITIANEELDRSDLKLYSVPLGRIVKGLKGESIMKNTVALGSAVALLDYDLEILNGVVRDSFKPEIAELNVRAAKAGYDYVQKRFAGNFEQKLHKTTQAATTKLFITGAEAIGLGAIKAGCKFYVAYPMTPATPLLHFLAPLDREFRMIVLQAESEIAAINMVVGASFAGARAMTATSGGGFCLMSEGFGMAGMTESPIVIVLAQRPGPSTGLPTYSGQGDLNFVIHASQGEFPRVIIAPGDAEECFYKTVEAFNISEMYQMPVILLTDKYLMESHWTSKTFNQKQIRIDRGLLLTEDEYTDSEEYKRHQFTKDGISRRAVPGTKKAIVRTNADEHDESGYTTEDSELTTAMNDKRFRKLQALLEDLERYDTTRLYGRPDAEFTILGWGSTKGPIREAMKLLTNDGLQVNYLQIIYLSPFPSAAVQKIIESARSTIVVENNKTSQLSRLMKENLLERPDHTVLKYDGRPFDPGEISHIIKELP